MKKFIYFVFFLCILSFIGYNVYNYGLNETLEPPKIKALYKNKKIDLSLGSYNLKSIFTSMYNDPLPAPQLLKSKSAIKVEKGTDISIDFSKLPIEISAKLWDNDIYSKIEISQNKITTPSKAGIYIYEIEGKWKIGKASYLLKVEVI